MSKEQQPEEVSLEEQAEAFKAWKREETIQFWNGLAWENIQRGYLGSSMVTIRRKPQPKLRPFKPEEVPVGGRIKYKHNNRNFLITGADSQGIYYLEGLEPVFIYYDRAMLSFLNSTDNGKTWLPCGVEE